MTTAQMVTHAMDGADGKSEVVMNGAMLRGDGERESQREVQTDIAQATDTARESASDRCRNRESSERNRKRQPSEICTPARTIQANLPANEGSTLLAGPPRCQPSARDLESLSCGPSLLRSEQSPTLFLPTPPATMLRKLRGFCNHERM